MKTICIYHSVDLDGWMSAAIVKHYYNLQNVNNNVTNGQINIKNEGKHETIPILYSHNELNFIGYNYGQPIPDLSGYDKVIMCDISFPIDEMEKLRQNLQCKFIWIDHHISIIKEVLMRPNTYYGGIKDTKFAACELTWKYFFPEQQMPEIVRLLGRYDCLGHKGTNEETKVLEFQYGARSCISNYNEAYFNLLKPIENTNNILGLGIAIYQYLCTEAKQVYKNGFEIELSYPIENLPLDNNIDRPGINSTTFKVQIVPFTFRCINKERFNPINFGIKYHENDYDGVASFHYVNGKWNFSLYNDNGLVDCSLIAKQFGGGGHKGAAGFIIDNIEDFIKTHKI